MNKTYAHLTATPLVLVLAIANACAQTEAPSDGPADAAAPATTTSQAAKPGVALQEVVVTATRRSANLQKVPATVDVGRTTPSSS